MKFKNLKTKLSNIFKPTVQLSLSPEEESSVQKIKQLQDEINNLQKRKIIEEQSESSYLQFIDYINDTDHNILDRHYSFFTGLNRSSYNYKKEVATKWKNFINLFDFMEDTSKQKIIDYLISHKETKQILREIDQEILSCKQQIASEKSKLGIE